MIKIALGQIEVHPGHPDLNTAAMLEQISLAKANNANLIVFPEMAVPGYLLGDSWEQTAFLKDCEYYGQQLIEASENICIMFGSIAIDWSKKNNDGRVRKYNAFFTAYNKHLLSADNSPYPFTIKTLQPNYREFDDTRHFFSLQKLALELEQPLDELIKPVTIPFTNGSCTIGCLLCEDGWSDDYAVAPLEILSENYNIDLFVNISSSPYTLGKNNKRNRVFGSQAKNSATPIVYVNAVGIQNNGKTVYTFDGSSTVYDNKGQLAAFCQPYTEAVGYWELDLNSAVNHPVILPNRPPIADIYDALSYGIRKFLNSIGMKKIVIGISGGIDSAVAAALYAAVVGKENLLLVNMPSVYNSATTKNLSAQLAANIGCNYTTIPIQEVVDFSIKQFENSEIINLSTNEISHLSISSFTAENIQARDRSARILAGAAAAFGGGFTCNANKAETTVGYSTLYGDQSGFLAALADLWKFQIYELARYLNDTVYCREVVPQATIDIVPSAELSANQNVDEGKGDPIKYPYHDFLFRSFMEHWNRTTPEDILEWYNAGTLESNIGCQPGIVSQYFTTAADFIADLERWWKLYSGMAVAKRIQAPPILAVSRRAYGFDHREAQNGVYYTHRYKELKWQILEGKA